MNEDSSSTATPPNEDSGLNTVLYHYTTVESCMMIIQSASIRLTNIHFLNDLQEQFWFRRRFSHQLRESKLPDEVKKRICDHLGDAKFASDCCFCLSTERDSLSQWRSYAANGCGVAIGFEMDQQMVETLRSFGGRLTKVVYCESQMEERIAGQIRCWENVSIPSASNEVNPNIEAIAILEFSILNNAMLFASEFKHPGFNDEREWRIVLRPWPQSENCNESSQFRRVKFEYRATATDIIPFVTLPIAPSEHQVLRVREIVFGPRNPMRTKAVGFREHMKSAGIDPDSISFTKSAIPYTG